MVLQSIFPNHRVCRHYQGADKLAPIEKAMVGYDNLIAPYYQPRVFFEQVDGKRVMVIWVTAGERRPYKVSELHLTEGRGTCFPTIHEELRNNGSADSIIEADDEHTCFFHPHPLPLGICMR